MHFPNKKFRNKLSYSISTSVTALCVSGLIAVPAHAQDNEDQGPSATNEENVIVVTGQALAQSRAIEAKRASDRIVDVVSQDDVGRLPDLNTAAILRRLPGVSIQNDQGEARFPVIRGFPPTYNRVTVDGAILASPERGTRTVPLDIISASLLRRLELVKTPTASMDPNAIGGTIDILTRSAFAEPERTNIRAEAFLGFHEQTGEGGTLNGGPGSSKQPYRVNAAITHRFGSDEQFGIVIAGDYSIRNFEVPQVETDDADYTEFDDLGVNVGLGNGNGLVVPTNNRLFFYNNVRERIGGNAKFEWQPSEDLRFTISGLYTEFNDDERRDEFRYELGTSTGSNQPDTVIAQTPSSVTTEDGLGIVGLGRFVIDRTIYMTQANLDWEFAEGLRWTTQVSYSGAELNNPESTETFQSDAGANFGARVDVSGFFPVIQPLDPDAFFDPANFVSLSNRGGTTRLDRSLDEDLWQVRSDLDYERGLASGDLVLSTGGLYRKTDRTEQFQFQRFRPLAGGVYRLSEVADFSLGDEVLQGGYRFPFRIDSDGALAAFENNQDRFSLNATSGNETTSDEEIVAGYGQAEFRNDQFSLIGGLRIENTEFSGGTIDSTVSGSYTDYLPSALIRYNAMDDLVLRAAYSQTIGRPNISSLTSGENVSSDGGAFTVSRSNPDLQPRKSNNFDAAVEYYMREGLVGIGVFYKDISDEIFTVTTRDAQVTLADGTTITADITQPENAQSASLFGIEAQAQQRFYFLPKPFDGFGMNVNATYLDGDFTVPTSGETRTVTYPQQPEWTVNATLFYAVGGFEARASYNYTGSFIDSIEPDDANLDEYWKPREIVDAQIRFAVNPNLTLIGEVNNIFDTGRTEVTGPGRNFLQESARFGRTYWIGASARF